jgi:streptogramin lyase
MKRAPLFFVLLGIAIFVSACGGGGGSGTSALPNTGGGLTSKSTGATVHVLIPKNSGTTSSTRKPAFIASNTATITIGVYTVNGATPSPLPTPLSVTIATSSDCTTGASGTSCTITVTVPIATSVVLQLSTYDSNGDLLGQALIGPINTTLATIPPQSVSVGGVPANISITPNELTANDDGGAHQISFTVTAVDASGNTILPPGSYPNPIALTISGDTNSALSLSITSIASPGPSNGASAITLTYNSAIAITSATITATSGSVTASVPFAPTLASTGGGSLVGAPPKIYEYATTANGKNYGIATGPDGQTLWFLDRQNAQIGSVTSPASCNTTCSTIAEQNPFYSPPPAALDAITAASDGNLYVTDTGNGGTDLGNAYQVTCAGTTCSNAVSLGVGEDLVTPAPGSVLSAPDGNLYIGSQFDNLYASSSILAAPIAGCCSIGFSNIVVTTSGPSSVNGMTVDTTGQQLWFTDAGSNNIGYFPIPCGACTAVELPSGSAECQECGTRHRPLTSTHRNVAPPKRPNVCCSSGFTGPLTGIVLAPDGNLYVADQGAHTIDQISPSAWESCIGESCTYNPVALSGSALPMNLIVGPDGNIWFTDTSGYIGVVRLNTCSTGTCQASEYAVGGAPWGITAGPDGDIWFTDSSTNAIGKVVLQ